MALAGVLGMVAAGGQSRRMGHDKGLALFQDSPMARRAANLLQLAGLKTIVSINATQLADYNRLFLPEELLVDSLEGLRGPLPGILSVHRQFPGNDLLVVACDMPLLQKDVLMRLLAARSELLVQKRWGRAGMRYIAFDSGGIQPLCAIYNCEALQDLLKEHEAGQEVPFCPRRLMAASPVLLLEPASKLQHLQFSNANTPEELAETQRIFAETEAH